MIQYRDHVLGTLGILVPHVESGAELIEHIRKIPVPDFEAGNGWETKLPFPGAAEKPDPMGSAWRMICACRLYDRESREIGVLFTTFVSGRKAMVYLSPPGTVIPDEYLPLASRTP